LSHKFDPRRPLIIARVKLFGPSKDVMIDMALDTGATSSLIGWHALQIVGYDASDTLEFVKMTTGNGIVDAPKIKVKRLEALGERRLGLNVVGHTLPPSTSVDGLLGLDFFRKRRLTIDFRKNLVKVD